MVSSVFGSVRVCSASVGHCRDRRSVRFKHFRPIVQLAELWSGALESVLGATPHEFKSRILRREEEPPTSVSGVGGSFVSGPAPRVSGAEPLSGGSGRRLSYAGGKLSWPQIADPARRRRCRPGGVRVTRCGTENAVS